MFEYFLQKKFVFKSKLNAVRTLSHVEILNNLHMFLVVFRSRLVAIKVVKVLLESEIEWNLSNVFIEVVRAVKWVVEYSFKITALEYHNRKKRVLVCSKICHLFIIFCQKVMSITITLNCKMVYFIAKYYYHFLM